MTSTDNQIDDWRENTDFRRALLLILRAAKSECTAPSVGLGNVDESVRLGLVPNEDLKAPWGYNFAKIFEDNP